MHFVQGEIKVTYLWPHIHLCIRLLHVYTPKQLTLERVYF